MRLSRGRHARRRRFPYLTALLAAVLAMACAAGFASGMLGSGAAATVAAAPAAHTARIMAAVTAPDKAALARASGRARARAAAADLAAHTYIVRNGNSISAVAASRCRAARDWTGIYAASRALRWTAADANVLSVGQRLYLDCVSVPSMARFAGTRTAVVTTAARTVQPPRTTARHYGRTWGITRGYPNYCGDGDGDGWDAACGARVYPGTTARVVHRAYRTTAYSGSASPGSYSGFQACVIARESGGSSQVMNASGHYGLYQFSESTWQAYGGSASTFGHASVAEQNAVFATAMARGGQSNWAPYDGCLQ